ncbi:hypothetical protein NEISICOT_01333 [Neisseria sicca ATCC 29256]|uniref:Uncharacterized protein n=1 Tax=Neisseria sicca ATCC 29256 TaxID=547045 RepID=C6M491_NEISI|nr:hypothetical protein NEISICOT_01333 [Neisseria sicca ATCC 29256]
MLVLEKVAYFFIFSFDYGLLLGLRPFKKRVMPRPHIFERDCPRFAGFPLPAGEGGT